MQSRCSQRLVGLSECLLTSLCVCVGGWGVGITNARVTECVGGVSVTVCGCVGVWDYER